MASVNEIPTQARAQRFTISLAGVTRMLTLRWCPPAACWILDIAAADGSPIVTGVPVITGADLLAQYSYLGLGGALYAQSDDSVDAVPTYTDLGTLGHIYFVTP